jgi:ABC-type Fe3+/spermidine/putrescine transport system ATPase subunit
MAETILSLDRVSKRFGNRVIADGLSLDLRAGEFFTLLGPSGSGKSTLLRIVAGLERIDAGRVLIAGADMVRVPPWRRNVGMVFQQYALFPHMTVAENVGYGLRVHGVPRGKREQRARELLRLVGLSALERRNSTLLSGGEQQRVALARALALQPRILLLDEPLAALDEKIRREMQTELKHIQRNVGITFLYVTHDQEEALTMSHRIAVLNLGRCVQVDTPEKLYRFPRTRFVAGFFRGCNTLDAQVQALRAGQATLLLADRQIDLPGDESWRVGATAGLALRAEKIRIAEEAAACEVRLQARLEEVIYRGTSVDHLLKLTDGQALVATALRQCAPAGQGPVAVGFQREDLVPLAD